MSGLQSPDRSKGSKKPSNACGGLTCETPSASTIRNGHLNIGSQDCVSLAETYGTPLYVTSEDRICEHFRDYLQSLSTRYPKVQVLFAAKANGNLAVMRALAQLGAGADVFSSGELMLALEAGMPGKNCSLMAVRKRKAIWPLPSNTE